MTVNRKVTGTAASIPAGLMGGTLIALVMTLVGSVISGYLIAKEILAENSVGYCAMAILVVSSFVSSVFAFERIKRRILLICSASGAIYYALLLAMTALFFGGQYQGMGVTALMVLCGSGLALLLKMGQGKSAGRGSKRYAHR